MLDKDCVSVLPLMIYRAHGGRRLSIEEMIAFIAQYQNSCDSLRSEPIDRIFEYTGAVSNLDLQREELPPRELEPEERGRRVAEIFQRIAREIRS